MSIGSLIEFKGHREGIYLQIDKDASLQEVVGQLRQRLSGATDFFKGARVIGIIERALSPEELEAIRSVITGEFGLDMVEKPVTRSPKLIQDLEGVPEPAEGNLSEEMNLHIAGDTVFHRGNLRSGKRVESKGNLVVFGDVKPGAELVADGNIVVLGVLKGFAHAGHSGDEEAFVVATKLEPTQLRIAGAITRSPDEGYEEPEYPEMAKIHQGRIVFEPMV